MSDGPSFTQKIVSRLGTPPEPYGLAEVLAVCGLLIGIIAYIALEHGLARLLARIARWVRKR